MKYSFASLLIPGTLRFLSVGSPARPNGNLCSSAITMEANDTEIVARSVLYCAPRPGGRLLKVAAAGFPIVVFVVPVTRRQEVVKDKISHLITQPPTAREVEAEMHARENAAERRLLGGGREACERAFHSRQNLRRHVELEMVSVEEGNQHLRPGRADHSMSAWVGGVRGGFTDLRKPGRISRCVRVVVCIASPDRGHRPPSIAGVLGVLESDHAVGKAQVQLGKQPRVLRGGQVMRHRRRLGDLVPVVLDGPVPKTAGQRLVRGSSGAVGDAQ